MPGRRICVGQPQLDDVRSRLDLQPPRVEALLLRAEQRRRHVRRARNLDPDGDRRPLRERDLLRPGDGEEEPRLRCGAGRRGRRRGRSRSTPRRVAGRPGRSTVPARAVRSPSRGRVPTEKPAAAQRRASPARGSGRRAAAPRGAAASGRLDVPGGVELGERERARVARREGAQLGLELRRPEVAVGLAVDVRGARCRAGRSSRYPGSSGS